MSEALISTIVASVGTVLVAAIATLGVPMYRDIRRVRHQVENDHETNMRVEQDERHEDLLARFDSIDERLARGDERMGRIETQIEANAADIDALEDTINPRSEQ